MKLIKIYKRTIERCSLGSDSWLNILSKPTQNLLSVFKKNTSQTKSTKTKINTRSKTRSKARSPRVLPRICREIIKNFYSKHNIYLIILYSIILTEFEWNLAEIRNCKYKNPSCIEEKEDYIGSAKNNKSLYLFIYGGATPLCAGLNLLSGTI